MSPGGVGTVSPLRMADIVPECTPVAFLNGQSARLAPFITRFRFAYQGANSGHPVANEDRNADDSLELSRCSISCEEDE